MQPAGDRRTAESAILLGVVNGLVSPPYLRHGCGRFDGGGAGHTCCQLASFVAAVLGVALLVVDMALSRAAVLGSPVWPPVLRWTVWLAKVLTAGTFQLGVNGLYFCLKTLLVLA
ncbi:hypothetical protein U9M48_038646 [Paspalum notatum var. saurae]|uniref:Uncharacterized protein n=1 Tax=Paspalum notatum var. saurae TaxID=547442 RepID=A0AAQ3UM97_PASNO